MNGKGNLYERGKTAFLSLCKIQYSNWKVHAPKLNDVVTLLGSDDMKTRSYGSVCMLEHYRIHIESESREFIQLGGPQALSSGLRDFTNDGELGGTSYGGQLLMTSFVIPYLSGHYDIFSSIIAQIVGDLMQILMSSFDDIISAPLVQFILHPKYTNLIENKCSDLTRCMKYSRAPEHPQWTMNILKMVRGLDLFLLPLERADELLNDGILPLVRNLPNDTTELHDCCLQTLVKFSGSVLTSSDLQTCIEFARSMLMRQKHVRNYSLNLLVELAERNKARIPLISNAIPDGLMIDLDDGFKYWNIRAIVTFKDENWALEVEDQLLRICQESDGETSMWAAYTLLECYGIKPSIVENNCNINAIIGFLSSVSHRDSRYSVPVVDVVLKAFCGSDDAISKLRGHGSKLVEVIKSQRLAPNLQYSLSFLLCLADMGIERWETLLPLVKMYTTYTRDAPTVEKRQIFNFMFECSFENAVSVAKAGACDLISVFKSVIDEKDNKLLYFMWNLAAVGSTHQFLKFPAITMHHNQRHIFDKIQWMLQNTELLDTYKDLSSRSCGCIMPSNFCHNKTLYPNHIFEESNKNTPKSKGKKKKKAPTSSSSTHPKVWTTLARMCTQAITILAWRNSDCEVHKDIVSNLFDNVLIGLEILRVKGGECGDLPVHMARIGLNFSDFQVIQKAKQILKVLGKPAAPPVTKSDSKQRELELEMEYMDKLRVVAKREFEEADKIIKELTQEVDIVNQQKADLQAELKAAQPQSMNDLAAHMSRLSFSPFDFIHIPSLSSLDEIEFTRAQMKKKMAELKQRKAVMKEEKKRKEQDQLKEMLSCPICMDRKKDTILQPCGHPFCKLCAEAITAQSGKCPVCRHDVSKMVPFFI